MNVLIVEDDTETVTLLIRQLERFAFDIDAANDGEEAWGFLTDQKDYQLMILDLSLPRLDGFGLLERRQKNQIELKNTKNAIHFDTMADYQNYLSECKTKKLNQLRAMPILVVSGTTDKDTIMKLRENGVANFVKKPVSTDELCQRVSKLLGVAVPE